MTISDGTNLASPVGTNRVTAGQCAAVAAVSMPNLGAPVARDSSSLRMLWINHHASFVGGCESYIHRTAQHLANHNVQSMLMYDVAGDIDADFTKPFAGAFPIVDLERQLSELDPDLIFLHQLQDEASRGNSALQTLIAASAPVVKFFHDHRLFCLREHKYTTLGQNTCTQTTGLNCYQCLGFLQRGGPLGVKIQTLGRLEREQQLYRQLDAFIVGSQYMRDHVIAHQFNEQRVHCVPLYASTPSGKNFGLRDTSKVFFAGALVRGKGLDILLQAIARSDPRLQLCIAGEGRQAPLFHTMAKRLEISDRVHFLGKLNGDQMQEHLATSLCVALPSRTPETFGLIGLEAMTHGTPVIATRVGGIGEWLEHDVNGFLVEPGNVDQLADALDELAHNIPRAIEMGELGLQKHASHFTPEHHVTHLMQAIRSIVQTEGASHAISVG